MYCPVTNNLNFGGISVKRGGSYRIGGGDAVDTGIGDGLRLRVCGGGERLRSGKRRGVCCVLQLPLCYGNPSYIDSNGGKSNQYNQGYGYDQN